MPAVCVNLSFTVYYSRESVQFPVKLTAPLTAIMYITADKVHMEELKHAIHVKEIAIGGCYLCLYDIRKDTCQFSC